MAIPQRKEMHKKRTYDRGVRAELWAALWLKLKGYQILETRFKTAVGEVDIIARKRRVIAFVEVKARGRKEDALGSLTSQMRERIERTASYYMARRPEISQCDMRFDLIALSSFSLKAPFFITHLDNAWRPTA